MSLLHSLSRCLLISAHTCSCPTHPAQLPGGVLQFCPNSGLVGIWKPVQQTPPPHWFVVSFFFFPSGADPEPCVSQELGGIGIYVPAAGARRKGEGLLFLQEAGELFSKVRDRFVFLGFPSAPNNKVQELLGEVWYKAPSRSRRPRRKGCSSAAKWSFKGTQRAVGSLGDCGLSLLRAGIHTNTSPGHPAKLTLQDIPAGCDNLPLLRKTAGNLILLPALPSLFV